MAIISFLLHVSSTSSAQSITINKKNALLSEIFKDIRKQTDYDFIYTDKQLATAKKVSISVKNASVKNVLDKCFENQPLFYKIKDKTITIEIKLPPSIETKRIQLNQLDTRGMVIDEVGMPLSGAGISVKGLNKSTITNNQGEFLLTGVNDDAILVISYIGYVTQEIPVKPEMGGVKLLRSNDELNEIQIVSTGYQMLPKERATGSFSVMNINKLNRKVSLDILSRLEDEIPGLVFNRKGANPITIRGTSTINSNSYPLIVVDNFPYDGDISNINPNDVERITVLKDAAAASIWGARAGNGVIVIDTKKGKLNNSPRFSFNSNLTVSEKQNLFYEKKISTSQFIDIETDLFNKGFYRNTEISVNKAPLSPIVETLIAQRDGKITANDAKTTIDGLRSLDARNDFSDYILQNPYNQQYALNLSGGSDKQQYYISGGYDRNLKGEVGNSYKRVSINASNSYFLVDRKLQIKTELFYTKGSTAQNNPGFTSLTLNARYPYLQLINNGIAATVDNQYRSSYLNTFTETNEGLLDWTYKPLEEIELNDNSVNTTDYRLNFGANYQFLPTLRADILYQYGQGLNVGNNYRSQATFYTRNLINGITIINADGSLTRPIPLGGILDRATTNTISQNARMQLNFSPTLGNRHSLNALAGTEIRDVNIEEERYRLYGYDEEHETSKTVDYTTSFKRLIIPTTTLLIENGDSRGVLTDRFLSYYANGAYSYNKRYVVSASARFDQSNLFGVKTNQKGVPLWSAGAKWNIHEEAFYKLDYLDQLSLRATYGYSGNVNKNLSAYATAIYNQGVGNSNNAGTRLPYGTIVNPPNPELRWERVKNLNLGVDFSSKNQRINGTVEYFKKVGIDLIGTTPFAPSSGILTFTGNTANTKAYGIDFNLNTINFQGSVRWNSIFLFSYNHDEVTDYKVDATATDYVQTGINLGKPLIGKPLYAVYSYQWAGLDAANGDPQGYLNGEISKDYQKIIADARPNTILYHGSARPTVFGVLRNEVAYKGFTLSTSISYRMGYYFRNTSIRYGTDMGLSSGHIDYTKKWNAPGDERTTYVPSIPLAANTNRDAFFTYSSILVEKGDHIRLQDVNLSYEFAKRYLNTLKLKRAQVYLYANNMGVLWQASKTGLDPDYQTGPPPKTIALGLKVDF
ncbi:SusC/RagA family TonB-linked outer membrane protein [Pedobacter sp. Du54]|uniref:SusC/RagA family TonB-linked outer membrane protein n=1 Tax=Pedobacter anseongensis TaxID=3133439 RepID=UPI0030ADAB88